LQKFTNFHAIRSWNFRIFAMRWWPRFFCATLYIIIYMATAQERKVYRNPKIDENVINVTYTLAVFFKVKDTRSRSQGQGRKATQCSMCCNFRTDGFKLSVSTEYMELVP